VSALKSLNGLRNAHRIRAGRYLVVPMQGAYTELAGATSKPEYMTKRRNLDKSTMDRYAKRYAPPANHKQVTYVVKDKDTLGEIAEWFRTRASKIRSWNNLSYRSYIYPGQKLKIYVPDSFDVSSAPIATTSKPDQNSFVRQTHTVRKGETIYSISKRYNVRMSDVLAWNSKRSSRIYPGQTLEIWRRKN
jgi:LysM repeat protein